MSEDESRHHARDTIAAHTAAPFDAHTGSVAPPLHMATTFARDEDYGLKLPASYGRSGTPTLWQAEDTLCRLEGGAACMLYGSGMAAITGLMETLKTGSHVVAQTVMYHGTRDWLRYLESRGRISVTLFDPADPDALEPAIRPGETELVWIETPANPTWDVVDIRKAAEAAHRAGAILGVDSTVASPVLTRPLELGVDIVFHSATKYLNGHSDVLAGALITRNADERWKQAIRLRLLMGSLLAPMPAWMLMRGMRTLPVRVRQASANALAIAERFKDHPGLEGVLYPGLSDHRGHETAKSQMDSAFGGMMSILVKGGMEETSAVIKRLKVFIPATSLGGVESLVEHRKIIEGPDSPVPDNLIRLSIGIEAVEDLISDLEQALG